MKKIAEHFRKTITYICIFFKSVTKKLVKFIKQLINAKFDLLKIINKFVCFMPLYLS